jgi:hypothetical protein
MARQEVTFDVEESDGKMEQMETLEIAKGPLKEMSFEKPAKPEKKAEPKAAPKAVEEEKDFEIEVVDDTPPKDRGKKPSAPPEDPTDEELSEYSEKVRKRLQHFTKGYHDERRAKEQALREREELESLARKLLEENKQLKVSTDRSHNTLIEQAKQQVALELEAAKKKYKDAYEAGDADQLLAAQEALTTAKIRADKVAGLKPKALQNTEVAVQQGKTAPQQVAERPQAAPVDQKAVAWRDENSWFGADDEMTAYALGYSSKLVKEGVDPRSDEYYEKINSRMRKMFPDAFDADGEDEQETPKPKAKAPNVVAPATRSTAPKKVTLTQSQVMIAKRLGVPLDLYAKQVAELRNTK